MRSFQAMLAIFFAFFTFALAQQSSVQYDATVYITSTVYRVNTVTLSSSPTAALTNQTSTFAAGTGAATIVATGAGNATSLAAPTSAQPSPSQFTGAASSLNVNVFVAAVVAGAAYLAL